MDKKNKIVLKSKIKFNKKIAMSFSKPEYYIAYGDEILNLNKKDQEKRKFSTSKKERITKRIEGYKKLLKRKKDGYFYALLGIYEKNKSAALLNNEAPLQSNLMSLVSSIPVLITSYARIRKNKGASTLGAMLSFGSLKSLNTIQRRFLSSTANAPDGLTYQTFAITSKLLRTGKYPFFY